jgi:hypothetical protein
LIIELAKIGVNARDLYAKKLGFEPGRLIKELKPDTLSNYSNVGKLS